MNGLNVLFFISKEWLMHQVLKRGKWMVANKSYFNVECREEREISAT